MLFTSKIPSSERSDFYQSKFDYYKKVGFYTAILTALMETTYFVSDCQIFGYFTTETLLPRFIILLPMLLLILFQSKIKNYRIGSVCYYMLPHLVMWCTIWAIWYLPNRDFAREGFIIMHFAFLAVGLATPIEYHIFFHAGVILNIVVSNLWIHYATFDQMVSLSVPLWLGLTLMLSVLQNSYVDHYLVLKQIEKEAITDQLTGVFNRNKIYDLVTPGHETIRRDNAEEVTVLMMDVDKFKEVNDTYGHDEGDKILIMLANAIKECIRKADVVIRWGGEEFVVFLLGADVEAGVRIGEEIRQKVEEMDNGVCPVTVSVGVAQYDLGDYRATIRRADKALYYAKATGRNRVVVDKEVPEDASV